jgi:hypothetical protein
MKGFRDTLKGLDLLLVFLALITAPFVLLFLAASWIDSPARSATQATSTHVVAAKQPIRTENLAIVTDAQTGKAGYIAYTPTDFTLPAHSTVRIRITNFDGATPQKPAKYARVWGTVGGTIDVQTFRPASPNELSAVRTFTRVNPATQVSHTFTVAGMNLNAPIYPSSVTTFIVHTGKPGKYPWRCWNPCGGGSTGWTQPMSDKGYMTGTITVA